MKKTLTSIIAGIGLLGIVNCSRIQNQQIIQLKPEQIQKQDRLKKSRLDEIAETVHCIKSKATYQGESGERKEIGFGSAFAYREIDGYTYVLTNQHVVGEKEKKTVSLKFDPKNKSLELIITKLTRKDVSLSLVDNEFDTNPSDDIKLDLIYESEKEDWAILRTTKKLKTINPKYLGDSDTLHYGERTYLIGYPMGLFKAISEGIVGNPGKKFPKGKHMPADSELIISLTGINPGNSGGPFFTERDGELYWMGLIRGTYINSWKQNSHLAVGIKSNNVKDKFYQAINGFCIDETKKK